MNWYITTLLVIVGVVELGGDFEHSVQDGCCVSHVPLLLLPLHIQIPKPVRVEVHPCCCDAVFKNPNSLREKKLTEIVIQLEPVSLFSVCVCILTCGSVRENLTGSCPECPVTDLHNGSTDLHSWGWLEGLEYTPRTKHEL